MSELLVPSAGSGLLQEDVFTSSGTWTKPAGCKLVEVIAIGGGGGGAAATGTGSGNSKAGGGGGGGGYIKGFIDAANLAATETVSIAAAAAGGTSANSSGSNGGVCYFSSLTNAVQGYGGYGGSGSVAVNQGGAGGSGGSSGKGANVNNVFQVDGQQGGSAFIELSSKYCLTGVGGNTPLGHGSPPREVASGALSSDYARGYGSGGGGGASANSSSTASGKYGAPGVVIVRSYG